MIGSWFMVGQWLSMHSCENPADLSAGVAERHHGMPTVLFKGEWFTRVSAYNILTTSKLEDLEVFYGKFPRFQAAGFPRVDGWFPVSNLYCLGSNNSPPCTMSPCHRLPVQHFVVTTSLMASASYQKRKQQIALSIQGSNPACTAEPPKDVPWLKVKHEKNHVIPMEILHGLAPARCPHSQGMAKLQKAQGLIRVLPGRSTDTSGLRFHEA